MVSNNAPVCTWVDQSAYMPEGCARRRLFVDGVQTSYFIDESRRAAHKTNGDVYGLFGSGMHPRGIALTIASGPRIAPLKHVAEQMATGGR